MISNLKKLIRKICSIQIMSRLITSIFRNNPIVSDSYRKKLAGLIPIYETVISTTLLNGETLHLYHDEDNDIIKDLFWGLG